MFFFCGSFFALSAIGFKLRGNLMQGTLSMQHWFLYMPCYWFELEHFKFVVLLLLVKFIQLLEIHLMS